MYVLRCLRPLLCEWVELSSGREVRIGGYRIEHKKEIRKCLGRDEKQYPGLVLNVDTDDVLVRCMHRVGQNRFTGRQLKMFVGSTKTKLSLSFHHQHQ